MKLKKFKEKDNKRIGIIVFTIVCILLVSGIMLYRTFAIFEVRTSQNVIKGTVQDPGNIYFAFYVNDGQEDKIQKEMPNKNYVLDETKSYCGVNGERDEKIKVTLTDEYGIYVTGVTTSRTKCNLYFVSGAFILGKPIKAITSGEGLYEVTHEDVSETTNDTGFKETEFRYAGKDPNNYVTFNDEKWRIIGLVNVMTSEDKVEQRVKIIRKDNFNVVWDTNIKSDWSNASSMKYLNNEYYYGTSDIAIKNDVSRNMIDTVVWNLGGISEDFLLETTAMFYKDERGTKVYEGRKATWQGNVGLMYPSDYGYATMGGNLERNICLEKELFNWNIENEYADCVTYNWLWTKNYDLTITSTNFNDNGVFTTNPTGYVNRDFNTGGSLINLVALYLKSNVKIVNDQSDGSQENPYKLVQI